MNVNELRADRLDHFNAADALIRAARQAGKDLAGAELEQFQTHIKAIKNIDALMDRSESYGVTLARDRRMPDAPRNPGSMFGPSAAHSSANGQPTMGGQFLRSVQKFASTPEEIEQVQAIVAYMTGDVRAAANLVPGSDGGYLIPTFVQSIMERNYLALNPVAGVARLLVTDNGAPVVFPVLSDTETAAQLAPAATTGADATVSGDTPPTSLTGPTLKAWKVSSKPIFVNREIVQDGNVDIISEVIGSLLARVIRFENSKFTSGNGTTEAEGFLTNCSSMTVAAVPLDLDIALDLVYSVSVLYRPQGVFMASDTTIKYLRKLKTGVASDKRYLWDSFQDASVVKGEPARLHGYPIIVNNDMPSVAADGTFAAGAYPLAFGDFFRFVIRQAEMNQPFLYNYPVPAKDGRGVILFRRSDSKLLVPGAIAKVSH
jgi:HK97 family phage major capsid protein